MLRTLDSWSLGRATVLRPQAELNNQCHPTVSRPPAPSVFTSPRSPSRLHPRLTLNARRLGRTRHDGPAPTGL